MGCNGRRSVGGDLRASYCRTIGKGKIWRDTSGGTGTCCSGLRTKGNFASVEFYMTVKGIFTSGGLGNRDKSNVFDVDG